MNDFVEIYKNLAIIDLKEILLIYQNICVENSSNTAKKCGYSSLSYIIILIV